MTVQIQMFQTGCKGLHQLNGDLTITLTNVPNRVNLVNCFFRHNSYTKGGNQDDKTEYTSQICQLDKVLLL